MESVCEWHKTPVKSVLRHLCCQDAEGETSLARDIISEVVTVVTAKKGVKWGLKELIPDVRQLYLEHFRVPDWVLLYFKLEAKIPDNSWQAMIYLMR